mmetsp:Transcript_78650/g.218381  ORF Transcript_78650/g.218381 Transcript_78650/m.218381 type:complete len:201 (+) Transcript_78650:1244-1846(+)
MMRRQHTPWPRNSPTSRSASAQSNAVGLVTTTNSAVVLPAPGFVFNAAASHATRARIARTFSSASSMALSTLPVTAPKPNIPSMPPILFRMLSARSMKSPRNAGTSSMRNVCPVGAVSKTMTSYSSVSAAARAIAAISSTPGGGDSKTSDNSLSPRAAVVPPGRPKPSNSAFASKALRPSRSSRSASVGSTSAAHKLSEI